MNHSDWFDKLVSSLNSQANDFSQGLTDDARTYTGSEKTDDYKGNGLSQTIYGLGGNDKLSGGGGNDVINGHSGANQLYGESGNDMIFGGNDGNLLDGGIGHDKLVGGASIDKINGDSGRDNLYGMGGNDKLSGGLDDDRLDGGLGSDILVGGAGDNVFLFTTELGGDNIDKIEDFDDYSFLYDNRIGLKGDIFSALAQSGSATGDDGKPQIQASNFHTGKSAVNTDHYLVYDDTTGALFYDEDGSGEAAAIQFAQFELGTSVNHADFFVF